MNQLAQSTTSPTHGTQQKMTPSAGFSTSGAPATGPNYNVNTTNLMGTPPTSRSTVPGMGMGMGGMGGQMGMQPGMGMQQGMAQPGMGMGMGMNYGGGMGMGYGMGPRPMYGGTGFGSGAQQMGYGGGGMGMGGAPGMMNPMMGMQPQQRQF